MIAYGRYVLIANMAPSIRMDVSTFLFAGATEAGLTHFEANVPKYNLLWLGDHLSLFLAGHCLKGTAATMKVAIGADFASREVG
jgi:hypothetical protein